MTQCPSCRGGMTEHSAERLYGRSITIDICKGCEGIWFDGQELLQLAPAATLALLSALVQDDEAGARPPLASILGCPRCGTRLAETHDRQRNTPFTYFRCPQGHGKFLTFFQFLRAKNFVRPLDEREIEGLRKGLRQVNCANCGAPVNIEREAICAFCRTPLAILDAEQVRKAIDDLRRAAEKPEAEQQALPLALAQERLRAERVFAEANAGPQSPALGDLLFEAGSPLGAGLRVLKVLLGAGR